jgi:hypothetical protein
VVGERHSNRRQRGLQCRLSKWAQIFLDMQVALVEHGLDKGAPTPAATFRMNEPPFFCAERDDAVDTVEEGDIGNRQWFAHRFTFAIHADRSHINQHTTRTGFLICRA